MAEKRKRIIFKNINLVSQKEVKTIADIREILTLNRALWTSTGASLDAINCDPVFLHHLDEDGNKRIMCFEIITAINWLLNNLRDKRGIERSSTVLSLEAINTDHKEGRDIALSASQALGRLKKAGQRELSLTEVRQLRDEIEKIPLSGEGIILPEVAETGELQQFLRDIIRSVGGADHPSGNPGVNRQKLEEFIGLSRVYQAWFQKGILKEGESTSQIKPLGEATDRAFAAFARVREKCSEYFIRCQMVAYHQSIGLFNPELSCKDDEVREVLPDIRLDKAANIQRFLKEAPLARPAPERVLYFNRYINCYYEKAMLQLRRDVLQPLWGESKEELSEAQWEELHCLFAAYEQWQLEKSGEKVAVIEFERLALYCREDYRSRAIALIDTTIENSLLLDEIKLLEKLILYQSLLIKFLNNFVYFPYLYDPQRRALFEMGTLIMDGRKFQLSVKVYDHARHKELAANSNMFILYVNVFAIDKVLYEVAIPVTSGGKGNLYIGKRGIFNDINGKDWDAMVTDIIENPISLSEALVTPFRKLARLLNTKIEELKNVAETKLNTVVKDTKSVDPPPVAPAVGKMGIGNIFMGGGIAIAALGSALALITKTISEVKWPTLLATILGAIVAVLLPTFISAFNKLRKRDLSTILEASGWAVNVRMNLTFKLGRFFTERPVKQKILRKLKRVSWIIILLICLGILLLIFLFRAELWSFLSSLNPRGVEQ